MAKGGMEGGERVAKGGMEGGERVAKGGTEGCERVAKGGMRREVSAHIQEGRCAIHHCQRGSSSS